jgi:hypothetical protein
MLCAEMFVCATVSLIASFLAIVLSVLKLMIRTNGFDDWIVVTALGCSRIVIEKPTLTVPGADGSRNPPPRSIAKVQLHRPPWVDNPAVRTHK